MESNPQLEFVKEQVAEQIELYTQRKHFNRKAAFTFTVVPATLAAVATVSIGASEKLGSTWLPILAMIATGIASILGAWESLFSNRKLWRINNIALTHLYDINLQIAYQEAVKEKPITQDETDQYFKRFKAIIEEGEKSYQLALGNE